MSNRTAPGRTACMCMQAYTHAHSVFIGSLRSLGIYSPRFPPACRLGVCHHPSAMLRVATDRSRWHDIPPTVSLPNGLGTAASEPYRPSVITLCNPRKQSC